MRMPMRIISALLVAVAFLVGGCSKKEAQSSNVALTNETSDVTAGGITWSYPSRWVKGAPRPMRVMTYGVPAAEGDAEAGECAVFYFGSQQGGTVDMNIERWGSQFEGAKQAAKTVSTVNSLNVTRVTIAGTYLAPSGPMMESQAKKDNFKLLGAIVEAPEGMVFFKLTGPAKTVESSEPEFNAMIGSIAKR